MGLAIVAEKVAAVGGELAIHSVPGQGSSFEMLLPLGVASVRVLVVTAGGLRYAVPLDALDAVRAPGAGEIDTVGQCATLAVDGRLLPLVRLAALFGAAGAAGAPGVALIARSGERPFALLVDAIVAEQDVLQKRLGPLLRRVRWFSGAAQLGDGSLVPVLALDDIARHGLGAAQPRALAQASAAAAARRVLVAEDSITSRLLLKHILEGAGCEVETAADGIEALSKLRLGRFDAIVSDVEMPHLDGLQLTAAIRADPASAALPVILLTSRHSPDERAQGLLAGADAYFAKGAFDQDQLLAALARLA
jgi:two-component system chemotaxis sensor kinase CheA